MNLPPLGKIKYLTIHCTATPEGRDNTAAEVTQWDIQRFHQPSYHYVVELDGDVVNTLDERYLGAHVGHANTGNLGISYVGGTETLNAGGKPKDTRTVQQKHSLFVFVQKRLQLHPGLIVRGHNEWPGVAKACPSFSVKAWLRETGLVR